MEDWDLTLGLLFLLGFPHGFPMALWADGTSPGLWAAKERVGLLSRASSGAFAVKNPTVNSRAFRISAMASSLRAKG